MQRLQHHLCPLLRLRAATHLLRAPHAELLLLRHCCELAYRLMHRVTAPGQAARALGAAATRHIAWTSAAACVRAEVATGATCSQHGQEAPPLCTCARSQCHQVQLNEMGQWADGMHLSWAAWDPAHSDKGATWAVEQGFHGQAACVYAGMIVEARRLLSCYVVLMFVNSGSAPQHAGQYTG